MPSLTDPTALDSPGGREDRGAAPCAILTINGGSSSLKFAAFDATDLTRRLVSGGVERIGTGDARLTLRRGGGAATSSAVAAANHEAAAALMIEAIADGVSVSSIAALSHRIVHGGETLVEARLINAAVLEQLRTLAPLAPEHLPAEIKLIEAVGATMPGVPSVACFDTGFHSTIPDTARIVPLPRRYWPLGVRRYGFHGISYEYLMEALTRMAPHEATGRVILAHLGAGASMAAVRGGRCIDTTMGFTPAAGLMMAKRTGDLDPGLFAFLHRAAGVAPEDFDRIVNSESGLLGVSETSPDVRDLLARRASDSRADQAISLFCYQARKFVGALAAALGGVDTLVFSAGIGENSPEIRREICAQLGHLGIGLDEGQNQANSPVISDPSFKCVVRVIPTDEERMLAAMAARVLGLGTEPTHVAGD